MARRICFVVLIFGVLMLTSCQPAHKYELAPKKREPNAEKKDDVPNPGPYWLTWHAPGAVERDLPIVFVPEGNPEWASLKGFWTIFPFPREMATAHVGLDPLSALAALMLIDHHAAVKIKVPRGLPDPNKNGYIPANNLPSFRKWQLGKALFHESLLTAGAEPFSCAKCHKPDTGFTDGVIHGKYKTLSLVNVIYNRRQFWDGRVETLEETLVRGLAEDSAPDKKVTLEQHNWPGFVAALVARKNYDTSFRKIFGVEHPTQDTVARALATYMRTILSGDSLYDRAEQIRKDKKAVALSEEHFLEPLKDESLVKELPEDDKKYTRERLAAKLVEGEKVFRVKGRCAACHTGPLFSDHDYHNVGYHGKEVEPAIGTETGRAVYVPVGLKDLRLIGAFRTPSLRNLVKKGPYFHNAQHYRLMEVVEFFDEQILPIAHLAAELKDGPNPRRLKLKPDEKEALVLFMRSLEGTPVDRMVAETPK